MVWRNKEPIVSNEWVNEYIDLLLNDVTKSVKIKKHSTKAYHVISIKIKCNCGEEECPIETDELYKIPLSDANNEINLN